MIGGFDDRAICPFFWYAIRGCNRGNPIVKYITTPLAGKSLRNSNFQTDNASQVYSRLRQKTCLLLGEPEGRFKTSQKLWLYTICLPFLTENHAADSLLALGLKFEFKLLSYLSYFLPKYRILLW